MDDPTSGNGTGSNVTPLRPPKPGTFRKGDPKIKGRQRGSGNRVPTFLKECIILAAELEGMNQHGKDKLTGFLRHVAREDLRAFCMLLGRVLPYTVQQERNVQVDVVYRTVSEVRQELHNRGIDIEVMTRLLNAPPDEVTVSTVIEHRGRVNEDKPDGDEPKPAA